MSISDENKKAFEYLLKFIDLCDREEVDECTRLKAFKFGWLMTAANLRQAAQVIPGGFEAEQARQVGDLEKTSEQLRTDTPDPEMERLGREGDVGGIVERLQRIRRGGGTH